MFLGSRGLRKLHGFIHHYRSYVPQGRVHSAKPTAASETMQHSVKSAKSACQ